VLLHSAPSCQISAKSDDLRLQPLQERRQLSRDYFCPLNGIVFFYKQLPILWSAPKSCYKKAQENAQNIVIYNLGANWIIGFDRNSIVTIPWPLWAHIASAYKNFNRIEQFEAELLNNFYRHVIQEAKYVVHIPCSWMDGTNLSHIIFAEIAEDMASHREISDVLFYFESRARRLSKATEGDNRGQISVADVVRVSAPLQKLGQRSWMSKISDWVERVQPVGFKLLYTVAGRDCSRELCFRRCLLTHETFLCRSHTNKFRISRRRPVAGNRLRWMKHQRGGQLRTADQTDASAVNSISIRLSLCVH